jgi:hypothetical protein
VLQLVDQLTPRYDLPQTIDEVRSWFVAAGLEEIDVDKGDNGIVGRARAPQQPASTSLNSQGRCS